MAPQLDEEIVELARGAFSTGSKDAAQKEQKLALRDFILRHPDAEVLSFIAARAENGDPAVRERPGVNAHSNTSLEPYIESR
jgi:hypothetical protein